MDIEKPLFIMLFIVIAASFFTIYFFNTQLELHKVITYLIVFVATLSLFQTETRLRFLTYWIIICAALLSVIGIGRYLSIPPFNRLWPGAEFSTFVSGSSFHPYIDTGLSLAIALLFCDIRPRTKILLGIALSILITAAILSYDKGGWLGFIALLIFIFALAGYEGVLKGKFWQVLLSLTFFLWIIGLSVGLDEMIGKLISAFTLNPKDAFNIDYDTTIWTRISIWKSAVKLALKHPLFGVGLGNFKLAYPAFRDQIIYNLVGYAHQDYLQFAVETGILGLISIIWFFLSFFKKIITEVRFNQSSFLKGLKVGGLAGCFCIAFHSLYDFSFHIPSIALLFAILCGSLMAMYLMENRTKAKFYIKAAGPSYLVSAVIIVLYILYLGRLLYADINYREGLLAMNNFSFTTAEKHFKKAISYVPQNAEYAARLGELYTHRSRFGDEHNYYQKLAIALYEDARSLNPCDGNLCIESGITNARYGKRKEAKEEFEKAILLDPNNTFYRSILTEYAIAWGELATAQKGFKR